MYKINSDIQLEKGFKYKGLEVVSCYFSVTSNKYVIYLRII